MMRAERMLHPPFCMYVLSSLDSFPQPVFSHLEYLIPRPSPVHMPALSYHILSYLFSALERSDRLSWAK